MKKILSNIVYIVMLIALFYLLAFIGVYANKHRPIIGTLHPAFVLLAALASAFTFVNYVNPFKRIKPFNCVTCLTGWIALILSYLFNVPFYCLYFPIGIFVGGMFERLTMKYL